MTKGSIIQVENLGESSRGRAVRKSRYTGDYTDKKHYYNVTNEQRERFVHLLDTTSMRICDAARRCDIPYENAKVINKIYKRQGRVHRRYRIKSSPSRCNQADAGCQPEQERVSGGPSTIK